MRNRFQDQLEKVTKFKVFYQGLADQNMNEHDAKQRLDRKFHIFFYFRVGDQQRCRRCIFNDGWLDEFDINSLERFDITNVRDVCSVTRIVQDLIVNNLTTAIRQGDVIPSLRIVPNSIFLMAEILISRSITDAIRETIVPLLRK